MTFVNFVNSLVENPYFGAGFGLVGVGAGLATLRKGLIVASVVFKRHFLITLEVPCRDKSYSWLLQWINRNNIHNQHLAVETTFKQLESGKIQTQFDFVPSVGVHFFNYKGNWIRVERNREQQTIDLNLGIPWETVKLTALGRNKNVYFNLLEEARTQALSSYEGKTITYVGMGHEWKEFGHPRKRKHLSSVILDYNISETILKDVREFINSSTWYEERGIPYRRGYLLYGPPGCGKTSFITALAGELEYSICVLNLSDRGLTDDRLNYLMNIAPNQSIILLEDIDSAFVSRQDSPQAKVAYDGLNRVTFSGLLNMLDGVASSEARILFMTTNYIERLDPALIRPGRVDFKEYIGFATDFQIIRAFKKFYPELDDLIANQFLKKVRTFKKPVSVAMLQGYFMLYKCDPKKILDNVQLIWSK